MTFLRILLLSCITFSSALPAYPQEEVALKEYLWQRIYYTFINGEKSLAYVNEFVRPLLTFGDLNGDGEPDLLVGKLDGTVAYFEKTEEGFQLIEEQMKVWTKQADGSRMLKKIDVGGAAAPELGDLDGDGDLDLLIGSKDGSLFYYVNQGNKVLHALELESSAYMFLRPGNDSVPRLHDTNADRSLDLIIGTRQGRLMFFQNAGTSLNAKFCYAGEPNCPTPPVEIGNISPEVNAVPEWVDWNRDGLPDLAIGRSDGRISFYYNQGTRFNPQWQLESKRFLFLDAGSYAAPNFYDLNNDGFDDLILSSESSNIALYENQEILKKTLKDHFQQNEINWNNPAQRILDQFCQEFDVLLECLTTLQNLFEMTPQIERTLDAYTSEILKPRLDDRILVEQKEEPLEEALQEPNEEEEEQPAPAQDQQQDSESNDQEPTFSRQESYRNELWLVSNNLLQFKSFIPGDTRAIFSSGDWDQDGDLDLIVGSASGMLYGYQNVGTAKEARWQTVSSKAFEPFQRTFSAPTLGDLDGDGDLDLLVGSQKGTIEWIRNDGTAKEPRWVTAELEFASIYAGEYTVPILHDLNQDQKPDLIIGNKNGQLLVYNNNNVWDSSPSHVFRTSGENHIVPMLFQWDQDNTLDIGFGSEKGFLKTIRSHGSKNFPTNWLLEELPVSEVQMPPQLAPHAIDLNGDGQADILASNQSGAVTAWLNLGQRKEEKKEVVKAAIPETPPVETQFEELTPEVKKLPKIPPKFERVSSSYLTPHPPKRSAPAFMNVDGDQDLDLIVGTRSGALWLYLNKGTAQKPVWELDSKNFLQYQDYPNSTPLVADLDNDGDQDLIVSSATGVLAYWKNEGAADFPELVRDFVTLSKVNAGLNSVPAVLDLNQDQLPDLIIGIFRGTLVQYQQSINGQLPKFSLTNRRYLDLDVGVGALPIFIDLDRDQQVELIVGSDSGKLKVFKQTKAENPKSLIQWQEDTSFKLFSMPIGAIPTFADIDADGDMDALVGSEAGTLYFYENQSRP